MRQGCPLSPALFLLALEPLALALCADQNVTGIPYAGCEFKLSLFADDALLTLTNHLTTLPNLLHLLTLFSSISGLRINLGKSVALNVSLDPNLVARLQSHFPFHWATLYIDYLGVQMTPTYSSLLTASYYPLLQSLTILMHTWQFPHLSWMGRIYYVKITVLPKLLYYFRTLPVWVPPHFLHLLQRRIVRLIWANKTP